MIKSPAKAIRAKCLDCSVGDAIEVRMCPILDCPLYPFRFGKNPFASKTEEEKKAIEDAFRTGKDKTQYKDGKLVKEEEQ